jgi:hypothetical protein
LLYNKDKYFFQLKNQLFQNNVCKEIGSALFTFLVGWHPSAVSWPPSDAIFAMPACQLNDIILYLHQE